MGLRKAIAYSKKKVVPYTRKSKKKQKSYVKTVPPVTVVKYSMGKAEGFRRGKFPFQLTLITTENIQIRDSSLEACRQFLNKKLETELSGQYFFRILAHPHHIQRENKMLTGAGADRMQTGMARSFGKTIGRAALIKPDQILYIIGVKNTKAEVEARKLIKSIKARLSCKVSTKTVKA